MNKLAYLPRQFSAFAAPPPPDITGIAEQLQRAFAEFKQKNDERLAQIEARGADDVVTREQVDRINAVVGDLKRVIDDHAARIGQLTVGPGGGGDGTSAAAAAAERFFALARGASGVTATDRAAYSAYQAGFERLMRAGLATEILPTEIRAAMSVGSDRDGGYLVPTEVSTEIERRLFLSSPMRQFARVITIGGDAWEAPWSASGGVSGGWVGERQARTTTGTPTVGMQRIEAHEQYAYPEITQKMLDDAAQNVAAFVTDETYSIISRTENRAFVSGDGVVKPRGFLSYAGTAAITADATRPWGKLQYVSSGAAGALPTLSSGASNPDKLLDAVSALNAEYRQGAIWACNSATAAYLRKLKDADGRYLIDMGSVENVGLRFSMFGHAVESFEDMPDLAADAFSLAFANFRRGYYIVDRAGFRLLRDPYTNKPFVGLYITKRCGGDVRNFDAIKLIKFAA